MVPEPNYISVEFVFYQIYRFFSFIFNPTITEETIFWFRFAWFVCLLLTIIFVMGIIYFAFKINKIRKEEWVSVYGQVDGQTLEPEVPKINKDWQQVLKHIDSDNPADWKLAIIEADKMLDEMVRAMGYTEGNLGDRLKQIESSDFENLNEAWEAHKLRNKIAHESGFVMTKREAQSTIDKFKKAFEEFDFI